MTNGFTRIPLDDDLDQWTSLIDTAEVPAIVVIMRPDGTSRSILRANTMYDLGMLLATVMSQVAKGCEMAAQLTNRTTDMPKLIRDAAFTLGIGADDIPEVKDMN